MLRLQSPRPATRCLTTILTARVDRSWEAFLDGLAGRVGLGRGDQVTLAPALLPSCSGRLEPGLSVIGLIEANGGCVAMTNQNRCAGLSNDCRAQQFRVGCSAAENYVNLPRSVRRS